ncbi:MAG: FadR family transcriptional regulator [Deltaproteobacteria bacterium]|nr:MAG: FadR family transcriptional regulator [Deltaproteobacteria bacterium]
MVSPMFKPIKQERLSVKIVNQIKSLIVDGKLKPGDFLPPERELVKLLNVSRPSLREALKALVGMGFLEITQGQRTMVKSLADSMLLEPVQRILMDDSDTVFELLEIRKSIETWNAYHAAQRATPEDIVQLENFVDSMRMLSDEGITVVKEDADFHLAISEATHNRIQPHIMFTIYDLLKQSIGKYYHQIDYNRVYQQHLGIVEAIKAKAAEKASSLMLEHLDYVEKNVRAALG